MILPTNDEKKGGFLPQRHYPGYHWEYTQGFPYNLMSILTCNNAASHNAVIYGCLGIIDNHRLSFIKVSPIIDYEIIADSHHYSVKKLTRIPSPKLKDTNTMYM